MPDRQSRSVNPVTVPCCYISRVTTTNASDLARQLQRLSTSAVEVATPEIVYSNDHKAAITENNNWRGVK